MDIIFLVSLASLIFFLVFVFILFFKRSNTVIKKEEKPRIQPRPRDGVPRRHQMARNRGARLRTNVVQETPPSDTEINNDVGESEVLDNSKIGAKKKAKLEAKAEKKAQKEAAEQLRMERRKKEQLAEEERRKLEAKAEEEANRIEEEARKAKEEQERHEYEEYLKMKEAFSVEEEGYDENASENQMNLLQEFINYIKNNKVVIVEDLAAHFKLKTQAVIDRIKELQKDDILTGVIDDRGKFIYVSQEEMNAIAKFIKQMGRMSLLELAENSNSFVDLTPNIPSVN